MIIAKLSRKTQSQIIAKQLFLTSEVTSNVTSRPQFPITDKYKFQSKSVQRVQTSISYASTAYDPKPQDKLTSALLQIKTRLTKKFKHFTLLKQFVD